MSASSALALVLALALPMIGANMKDDDDGAAEVGVYDSAEAASKGAPVSLS